VPSGEFQPNQTYDKVFILFIDAADHSSVVSNNPADLVYRALDLLHQRLVGRLASVAERHRCTRAQLWRWAGDGGLLVVHDDNESLARDTALDFVRKVLEMDLGHLRDEFADLGIRGDLHIRIGVHRGTLRYRGAGLEGSIYSADINFAAHLERAAPPDTAAISADVKQVAGDFGDQLEPVGTYENRPVYLYAPGAKAGAARRRWLAAHGFAGSVAVRAVDERPSQREKVRLLASAEHEVVDFGATLRTASHYLVTTERPAYVRDAVLALLRGGGRYRCVLMDPGSPALRLLEEQRGEALRPRIEQALTNLRRFKDQAGEAGTGFEVHLTPAYPGMACLGADLDGPDGLMLVSPYLTPPPGAPAPERGDMPHYVVSRSAGALYDKLRDQVHAFTRAHTVRYL
jgi:class 3 adenylate cyclase